MLTVTIGVAITVKFIVRILSQPAAFGIVSLYIPVPNQVCLPLGEVYVSHTFAVIVSVVLSRTVRFTVITLSQPAVFAIVSEYVLLVVQVFPLGEV